MNTDTAAAFDPQVELPPADGRLATLVARMPHRRIQPFEYDGRRLWLKRALPVPAVGWRAAVRDRLAGRPWPGMRWLPRVEWGSGPLLREARRLIHLCRSGVRVPEIVAASSHWMVLADTGKSMRVVLAGLGTRNRAWLLSGAAGDLAGFHAAGFWHGGAQVKNTTMRNGERVRIDFDDSFDAALTLADLQARDLFFFLMSCVDWVDARGVVSLAGVYRDAGGQDANIERASEEMSPMLDWRVLHHLPGGDLRRVLGAAAALREAVA